MKLAIVGITGLVGRKILQVVSERDLPVDQLIPVASEASLGRQIVFRNKKHGVVSIEDAISMKPDIAIFSAGSAVSAEYAPRFAEAGTIVIDNSSAWRMKDEIPLVVPEVNGGVLEKQHRIIANPNCSTIQMVMALAPIHRFYGIRRIVVATYQSVTGSGQQGLLQLENEREGSDGYRIYPHPIDLNLIPKAGEFSHDGYTTEEIKLVNETRKILGDDSIRITATAVRVPVIGGHSEAVNVELAKPFRTDDIRDILEKTSGIQVMDDPEKDVYPMPIMAEDRDEVFVGRIRRDHSVENGLNLWIVSDNLRKGAATNAVDIAGYLLKKGFISKQP